MQCNEAKDLIDVGESGNSELDGHLESCRECRAYYRISERLRAGNTVMDTPDLAAKFQAKLAAEPKRARTARWRFAGLAGSFAALLIAAGVIFNPFTAEPVSTQAEELVYNEDFDSLESYYKLAIYETESDTNYNAIDYYYSLAVY
ncbi:MAG: hypothetical protein HPY53_08175 [Brevinematales bacterium]|nr:hypothetical protein [Brevinematales bacterium]